MPRYEVHIGEVSEVDVKQLHPGEATPEIRSVFWRGDAIDEADARAAGYAAWDQKYGRGRLPVQALVRVTSVAE
jgi:hypothetical protein